MSKNRFPLGVAAAWLATVWALVLAADIFFARPLSLTAWAGDWDGGWYQSLVNGGYFAGVPTQQENLAFFPLYPLLVWLVSKLTQLPVVWAGMVVSSVSFTAALVVVHRFVASRWNVATARWAIFLLAFNPFSFYFGMMYTESLFLLLAAATLWYVYKKDWWLAALMAGLASGARSVGIALGAMVICAAILDRTTVGLLPITLRSAQESAALKVGKRQRALNKRPTVVSLLRRTKMGWQTLGIFYSVFTRRRKDTMSDRTPSKPNASRLLNLIALGLLSFSGLTLFSLYLWQHTGDPIAYSHIQEFWPGRGGLSNIIAELAYLWEHKIINLEYALMLMWYGATLVAFGGVALLIKMREYLLALYSIIALSLPLAFGTATAMNRYMLVAVPIFIAYAVVLAARPRWVKVCIVGLCVLGLGFVTFLMVNPRAAFVG